MSQNSSYTCTVTKPNRLSEVHAVWRNNAKKNKDHFFINEREIYRELIARDLENDLKREFNNGNEHAIALAHVQAIKLTNQQPLDRPEVLKKSSLVKLANSVSFYKPIF